MPVNLRQFVPAAYLPDNINIEVRDLFVDSREVVEGSGFFALRGAQHDGRLFIESACRQGAAVVFADLRDWDVSNEFHSRVIHIPDVESHVAAMAADFYGQPSMGLNTIAVTGTNGKTSVCRFIANAMESLLGPCAYMGTLGWGINTLAPLSNTTPDVVSVHRILANVKDAHARSIALEVSSHALHQGRVVGVLVDVAVFTNLSHDHLDYHGDMDAYAEVKRRLFSRPELQCAVINVDDEVGASWLGTLRKDCQTITYSLSGLSADIELKSATYSMNGTLLNVKTPWGDVSANLPVVGQFNVANVLATCAVLCHYSQDVEKITAALECIEPVPGRMERVGRALPAVVVDYAHTPDGLENALKAMAPHCKGQLWVVFGCGGDRDKTKRPLMAQIAEKYADRVVVTSDNPRNEDPIAIIADVTVGLSQPEKSQMIIDRREAIYSVIQHADVNDCILIAGKGHETYQIIGKDILYFDDRDVALKALQEVSR